MSEFQFNSSDELGAIARDVAMRVRLSRADRATAGDCFQIAYEVGLRDRQRAAARAAQHKTSKDLLRRAMRRAVYRMLKNSRRELRESDLNV